MKPEPKPISTQDSKADFQVSDGNKDAFDALLRQAVPVEASPPEDET